VRSGWVAVEIEVVASPTDGDGIPVREQNCRPIHAVIVYPDHGVHRTGLRIHDRDAVLGRPMFGAEPQTQE
jgi:hypothetical protein